MDVKAVAALIVSGMSALMGILALALPYWSSLDSISWSGLWKTCFKVFGSTQCTSIGGACKQNFNIEKYEKKLEEI